MSRGHKVNPVNKFVSLLSIMQIVNFAYLLTKNPAPFTPTQVERSADEPDQLAHD